MKNLSRFILMAVEWIGGFFQEKSQQSMMRLCTFGLVYGGVLLTSILLWYGKSGAHWGFQFSCLGILGKAYQKNQELNKKENGTNTSN